MPVKGQFIWCNFPFEEDPVNPGPTEHLAYVFDTDKSSGNAIIVFCAFTTSQPYRQTEKLPLGVIAIDPDLSKALSALDLATLHAQQLKVDNSIFCGDYRKYMLSSFRQLHGLLSALRGGQHLKCEIEFLPVGEGTKAGDAIIVRYGEPHAFKLMLIDGGHAATGEEIVAHLKSNFGEKAVLEHVLLTHSDIDHASGLRTVLEQIKVENLWLHVPWLLAEGARPLFKNKSMTEDGLRRAIKAEYNVVAEIFDLAAAAGCNMHYPFAGSFIGPFRVLSPAWEHYRYLLPQFDKTPDPDQGMIEQAGMWLGKETLTKKLMELVKAALQSWTRESWETELLRDGGVTSASNETSVVLYGDFEQGKVLLTGDAGVNGLTWAANAADSFGLPLQDFALVQIPHHGSRRNVGPAILTRLLGNIRQSWEQPRFAAFVSAPKDDQQHPRRIVLNAFKRRGAQTIATQGSAIVHLGGFPARQGYGSADQLPFYTEVEEYT